MKRRSLLYIGISLAVFGASSLQKANAQQRRGITRRVQFAPGASSSVINGAVTLGNQDTYIFRANEGQEITADITWQGERVDRSDDQGLSGFTFITPDGQSYEHPQNNVFAATVTGDYKVVIAQPYRLTNPRYTFKLTIR
ncbi:hypothetical protein NIES2119_31015 [[Phormidium ambiguum] IAM M-71]|uniref:Uncharacterized protein n=1 Tax=[Phormidium ambiguum] IAM M-71 TaxID=454136 RepID=A0A1U7I2W8_9CYAN|nr:hypothetical protein [Phormidium ambiguum]OKH30423.1 hypothetical protein NIES2119_31015 [Phormidium ambiguum IAM M-71]